MSGHLARKIADTRFRVVSLTCSRRAYEAYPAALARVEAQLIAAQAELARLEALAEETRP